MDWLIALDGNILLWIQEFVRNAFLTPVFTFYTQLGNLGVLWIALSGMMLCFKTTRKAGFLALLSLGLGVLVTNVGLKLLVNRPRPWLTVEGLVFLIEEHDPNSFPSGHSTAAFAAAGAWLMALPKRWMKVTGVVLAVMMGFSRLYVGVHFPSDVLGGAIVGLLCALLVWYLWELRQRAMAKK